jgi:predicted metal-dependent phosphotriesterase family hydrolase
MPELISPSTRAARPVMTVAGPISFDEMGITDAHNHVWIEGFKGADPANPVLDQLALIRRELNDYRLAGGSSLLDCQPGGCGRDGRRLLELSRLSGVHIIACTGFHRRKYYPSDSKFWSLTSQSAADLFISELTRGLKETLSGRQPVLAGFIKIALEDSWEKCPLPFLEAAAAAATKTGCVVEIHTEKGALAVEIVDFFIKHAVPADQLVICHIDKHIDFGLHAELARSGALLEYDTFFRPKYDPEINVWPLVDRMAASGLEACVTLATDMAEKEMYLAYGGGPGLASLPLKIKSRLADRGLPESAIQQLVGGSIARRLARLN